jgi:hypothetical protein
MTRWTRLLFIGLAAAGLAWTVDARAQGGETCATAELIPCGDVNLPTNTAGHTDDYNQATLCTGFDSAGPDVVFSIMLVAGASLNLTFDGPYDASVYLITDCNDPAGSCVAGSDTYPPGTPDNLVYTNSSDSDQTLYLIVDGFGALDFGPGVLHGTIGCTGIPVVVGACCNRSTGGCSVVSNLACAASDGIFQGEGTECSPTPCAPAESRCVLPGLTVTRDVTGDFQPQLGSPQLDVERVSMAQPYTGAGDQLDITLKVTELAADPANLPINALWTVFWENPVAGDPFPRKFVQMTSCDPMAIPSFVYGHAEPQATGGDLNLTDGPTPGSYTADGTIHFTIDPALVGNPQVGQTLGAVSGETSVFAPGANCTGLINAIDSSPTGTFRIEGNNFCRPFTVACEPSFTGDAGDGNIPLSFAVTNPSTGSRRFSASLSDANGWIVDGPISQTLNLAPGATGQVTASLHMTPDCAPSATDAIEFVATATDLPTPDQTRTCGTTASCEVLMDAVGAGGATLSFALGSNPVRGEAMLFYTLPARGRVKIELFDAAGHRVRTMADGIEEAGSHTLRLRTHETGGRALGPGVYLARITAGRDQRTLTAIVLE